MFAQVEKRKTRPNPARHPDAHERRRRAQTNIEDENALIRIAYKMAVSNINESTRTNSNFKDICHKTMSIDVGDEFNINTKLILRKKNGKRSYDESHSKGIFSGKSNTKSENIGEQDV